MITDEGLAELRRSAPPGILILRDDGKSLGEEFIAMLKVQVALGRWTPDTMLTYLARTYVEMERWVEDARPYLPKDPKT